MENLVLVTTVLAIHVFAWLTPGPMMVLIVRNSLVYSRKVGIWTAAGMATGNIVHVTYSVLAILFVISTSDTALDVIKYLGAAYLAYLGIKTLLQKSTGQDAGTEKEQTDLSPLGAFRTGFVANLLTPAAPPFFLSIFGAVLSSNPPFWVVILLMIAMPLNGFIMASVLSLFFTRESMKAVYSRYQGIVNALLGAGLILFALLVALY